jgi:ribosomal protein S21
MIAVSVGQESIGVALKHLKQLRERHGVAQSERRHQHARTRGERRRDKIARARKRRLSDAARRRREDRSALR